MFIYFTEINKVFFCLRKILNEDVGYRQIYPDHGGFQVRGHDGGPLVIALDL